MNTLKDIFRRLNSCIFSNSFKERFKTHPQYFTRERNLPFETVIFSILDLAKRSLQIHLNLLVYQLKIKPITKQAFSLSRQKISWWAFKALNELVINAFYENFPIRLFKGKYLLVAMDGSCINLPDFRELSEYFGKGQNNTIKDSVIGKISVLYDVLNKMTLDLQVVPYKSSEKAMAIEHLKWLNAFQKKSGKKVIIIFDRGYPCVGILLLLKQLGIDFVCRAQEKANKNIIVQIGQCNDKEALVKAIRPDARRVAESWFSLSDLEMKIKECTIRVIRSNKGAIYFTSLNQMKRKVIEKLYHKRWQIETNYRSIKVDTLLENFSGRKCNVIFQDLNATILVQNLARILANEACESKKSLYNKGYRPSHRECLGEVKRIIFSIMRTDLIEELSLNSFRIGWQKNKPNREALRRTGNRLRSRYGRLCYA